MTDAPPLNGLYHSAWACRDAEETRHFYEDVLGLPLVNCMLADKVPSTGEEKPYAHFFFEMGDGSYVAFFDLGDNEMPLPSPNTPAWVQHFAIQTGSVEQVLAMRARLVEHGVQVTPLVDHGFVKSVYFFDPNGIRLEVTARTEAEGFLEEAAGEAHAAFAAWVETKAARLAAKQG
ncbi:MAG: VOC family protein [Novosphingobium sp.]|nr:VOC family protein [Novosphingobium sp.]